MNRMVLGALAALLLVAVGIFWWQGRAETTLGLAPPNLGEDSAAPPEGLPSADVNGLRGPQPPEATDMTREQRRFDRFDRDRDGRITRAEILSPRAEAFRKLDTDHNNLLTFEEWAVKTSNRFKAADANGDGALTRPEFATTKPKPSQQPQCNCRPPRDAAPARRSAQPRNAAPKPPQADDSDGMGDEPTG